MGTEESKALARRRRFYEEVWDKGNTGDRARSRGTATKPLDLRPRDRG
jgi:hypothetical protein